MTIFNYALLRGIRSPLSMIVNCLVPLVIILIRPMWTDGSNVGFGLMAFPVMSGAFLMSQSILTDKLDGAIIRILAAPMTMRRYLAENLLSCTLPLMVQMALVSLLGFILYDWTLTLSFGFFLCYTMLTLATVGMSFAWSCLFKDKDNSNVGFIFVIMFMAILSGVALPLEILPGVLQYVGVVFPVYWAMQGLNSVLETGAISAEFWLAMAAMLLFTVAFLLYGGKRRII